MKPDKEEEFKIPPVEVDYTGDNEILRIVAKYPDVVRTGVTGGSIVVENCLMCAYRLVCPVQRIQITTPVDRERVEKMAAELEEMFYVFIDQFNLSDDSAEFTGDLYVTRFKDIHDVVREYHGLNEDTMALTGVLLGDDYVDLATKLQNSIWSDEKFR